MHPCNLPPPQLAIWISGGYVQVQADRPSSCTIPMPFSTCQSSRISHAFGILHRYCRTLGSTLPSMWSGWTTRRATSCSGTSSPQSAQSSGWASRCRRRTSPRARVRLLLVGVCHLLVLAAGLVILDAIDRCTRKGATQWHHPHWWWSTRYCRRSWCLLQYLVL